MEKLNERVEGIKWFRNKQLDCYFEVWDCDGMGVSLRDGMSVCFSLPLFLSLSHSLHHPVCAL